MSLVQDIADYIEANSSLVVDTDLFVGGETVDTPYAASLHEGISRWKTSYVYKTPGTGMKWIESKALMYKDGYVRNILDGFAQSLRSWGRRFRRMLK